MAKNPGSVSKRGKRISTGAIISIEAIDVPNLNIPKIRSLKTCRSSTINIEDLLEMLVQRIEKAITETPKEEEDRDESNGPDGFSQGEFSCFGNFAIFDL